MSGLDFSRRAELPEEMDSPGCDQDVLFATLRRFELTNQLFTRYRSLLWWHILPDMMRYPDRIYRFTDLGAGGCDIVRWLVRVCRRKNLQIKIRAVEHDPRIAQYAREANAGFPEIEIIEADACDPSCWGAPDYLFAQHLLHHLPDEACVRLLKALDQAEPCRFIVSDLLRSRTAYNVFRVVARPMARGTFILNDGGISIRRGFLEAEISQMIKTFVSKHPILIYRIIPSRMVIIGGSVRQ